MELKRENRVLRRSLDQAESIIEIQKEYHTSWRSVGTLYPGRQILDQAVHRASRRALFLNWKRRDIMAAAMRCELKAPRFSALPGA